MLKDSMFGDKIMFEDEDTQVSKNTMMLKD